jgi:hypothetical protein
MPIALVGLSLKPVSAIAAGGEQFRGADRGRIRDHRGRRRCALGRPMLWTVRPGRQRACDVEPVAIAPNHENPECEVVISECRRFAVVDKFEGWGLRISRETDPRSSSGSQLRTPA